MFKPVSFLLISVSKQKYQHHLWPISAAGSNFSRCQVLLPFLLPSSCQVWQIELHALEVRINSKHKRNLGIIVFFPSSGCQNSCWPPCSPSYPSHCPGSLSKTIIIAVAGKFSFSYFSYLEHSISNPAEVYNPPKHYFHPIKTGGILNESVTSDPSLPMTSVFFCFPSLLWSHAPLLQYGRWKYDNKCFPWFHYITLLPDWQITGDYYYWY